MQMQVYGDFVQSNKTLKESRKEILAQNTQH